MNLPITVSHIDVPHLWPSALPITWRIIHATDGSPFDISGLPVTLQIYEQDLRPVWSAATGGIVTVAETNLIILMIPDDDEYHDYIKVNPPKRYLYQLDIIGALRIQGYWRSIINAGPAGYGVPQ